MTTANRWDTLAHSMRSLLGTGIAIVHTRVELAGVELEQELWRARSLFIWSTAALLLMLLAIGFTGIALIVTFWDTHRELVSALVAGTFVALALVAVATLMSTLRAQPRPFESTLNALEGDLRALRRDS